MSDENYKRAPGEEAQLARRFRLNVYPEPHHEACTRFDTRFPWECDCQDRARQGADQALPLDVCPRVACLSEDVEVGPGDTARCNACGVRW